MVTMALAWFAFGVLTGLWLSFGALTGHIAQHKNIGFGVGCLLGLLLGPIGTVLVLVMRSGLRKCPHCDEEVKPRATICKHCGRELTPMVERVAADKSAGRVERTIGFVLIGILLVTIIGLSIATYAGYL